MIKERIKEVLGKRSVARSVDSLVLSLTRSLNNELRKQRPQTADLENADHAI